MNPKILLVIHNGKFKIMSITPETKNSVMDLMKKIFFKEELVFRCCDLQSNPRAIEEQTELLEKSVKQGVSLVAIDTTTNKVASAVIKQILVKNDTAEDNYYRNYMKSCTANTRAVLQFVNDAYAKVNVFDYYNTNCVMEVMFLATYPEYRKDYLATYLVEESWTLGTSLSKGENVKVSLDNKPLLLEHTPTAVYGMCTTFQTYRIAKKLGYSKYGEVTYNECFYKGESFASKVAHIAQSCGLISKKF